MKIEIRTAGHADFPAVAQIFRQSRVIENEIGRPPELPSDAPGRLRLDTLPAGTTLIAVADGETIGFVSFDRGEIALLYVAPRHFRKGAGRALLRAALDRMGEGEITVRCYERNGPARRLYEDGGFTLADAADGDCRYERRGPPADPPLEG
jgi:ribosomal protein S18 acetylase RimI-like enzyme